MRSLYPLIGALILLACGRAEHSRSEPEDPLESNRQAPMEPGSAHGAGEEEAEGGGGGNSTSEAVPEEEVGEPSRHPFCEEPVAFDSEVCVVPGDIAGIDWQGGLGGAGSTPEACPILEGLSMGVCSMAICAPAHSVEMGEEATECCYSSRLIHCR